MNDIDDAPSRVVLDDFAKHHGETLLEFLWDSTMCIINGRIWPLKRNRMSYTPRLSRIGNSRCNPLKQMVEEWRCF